MPTATFPTPPSVTPTPTASPSPIRLAPGQALRLRLEIRLEGGFVALSTFDAEPICCRLGDGALAPELESLLIGMRVDEEIATTVSGSDLYGARDPAKVQWLDRDLFPEVIDPSPGQLVAFTTPSGDEFGGVLLAVTEDQVEVDFNHPFAGHRLTIRARLLSIA